VANFEILFLGEIVLLIGLAAVSFFLFRTIAHYNKLTKGTNSGELGKVLEKMIHSNDQMEKSLADFKIELEKINHQAKFHIQKMAIVRFNPFKDTGSDQSFILAMLDETDTGVVITSLHQRGITRWYAKNVKAGKGIDHELSADELNAIKNAQRARPSIT